MANKLRFTLIILIAVAFAAAAGAQISELNFINPDSPKAEAQNDQLKRPEDFSNVVKDVQPGVVSVKVELDETADPDVPEDHPPIPPRFRHSEGSGFVVDKKGLILTNNHVVSRAKKIEVVFSDKKKYKASVVGRDPGFDLALIKIRPKDKLKVLKLGDSDKTKIGEWVIAMGNPLGLENNVTIGIVSGKKREMPDLPLVDFLQTDAGIFPGSSGGPLIDSKGEVVAVNTAMIPDTKIGLSIPINSVKKIIPHLKTKGDINRGFMGVFVIDPEKDADMEGRRGALVEKVETDGPAEKAGLKDGDIITSFEGKRVTSPKELAKLEADKKPGDQVEVKVDREGKEESFTVTLGKSTEGEITDEP